MVNAGRARRLPTRGSRVSARAMLVVLGVAIVVFVVAWMPRSVNAIGSLDECSFGSPLIEFDAEAWSQMPGDVQEYTGRQLPVLSWPAGMRYDQAANVLLDAQGDVVFGLADEVRVTGRIIDTQGGDVPPCFLRYAIRIEAISAP